MRWSGRSTRAGDLLDEGVAAAEGVAAERDYLLRVRRVRQVVGREDQDLGEPAEFLLVGQGVLLDLVDDLPVRVRRSDLALDFGGVELALVL
jgi:hypothetical protein